MATWAPQDAGLQQLAALLSDFQKPGANQAQVGGAIGAAGRRREAVSRGMAGDSTRVSTVRVLGWRRPSSCRRRCTGSLRRRLAACAGTLATSSMHALTSRGQASPHPARPAGVSCWERCARPAPRTCPGLCTRAACMQILKQLEQYSQVPDFNNYLAFIFGKGEQLPIEVGRQADRI